MSNYSDVSTSVGDVLKLSEMMERAGIAIVVIAVFLVIILISVIALIGVFIRKSKNEENQFSKLLTDTLEQNNKFIQSLIDNNNVNNQSGLFKISVECGALIEEHLKHLYHVTKADRVALYVFHNGQRMLNGGHLLKMSCLNEYSLSERLLYSYRHKDTPISQISVVCNALLEKGCWTCEDTSVIEDPSLKQWIKAFGYKSVFIKGVFNTHGEVIGFASAEYIEAPVYPDRIEIAKKETRRFADKVAVAIDAELVK